MPISASLVRRIAHTAILLLAVVSTCLPQRLEAQSDSARISYRTTEIAFFTAGRAEGVRVGDTVTVLGAGDVVVARAVVVSASLRSSSARLLGADVQVAVGQRVRFDVHLTAAGTDSAAAGDSTGALRAAAERAVPRTDTTAADSAALVEVPARRPRAPRRPVQRFTGGLQIEEMASSVGSIGALSSYQTAGSLYLNAPLGQRRRAAHARQRPLPLRRGRTDDRARRLSRHPLRTAAAPRGPGRRVERFDRPLRADGSRRPRLSGRGASRGPAGARSSGSASSRASCRRSRISRCPRPRSAAASTGRSAAAARCVGSLSAAADWSDGARRRTLVASQTYWRLSSSPVALRFGRSGRRLAVDDGPRRAAHQRVREPADGPPARLPRERRDRVAPGDPAVGERDGGRHDAAGGPAQRRQRLAGPRRLRLPGGPLRRGAQGRERRLAELPRDPERLARRSSS